MQSNLDNVAGYALALALFLGRPHHDEPEGCQLLVTWCQQVSHHKFEMKRGHVQSEFMRKDWQDTANRNKVGIDTEILTSGGRARFSLGEMRRLKLQDGHVTVWVFNQTIIYPVATL